MPSTPEVQRYAVHAACRVDCLKFGHILAGLETGMLMETSGFSTGIQFSKQRTGVEGSDIRTQREE